ncbi:hypothetical protein, partial [Acidisphaera rubrifaciens]|uniref:hypothetical protein n=1 Tax=Acidisphaera rubrifaciens TaxID=50715 RepID=UPI0019D71BE5
RIQSRVIGFCSGSLLGRVPVAHALPRSCSLVDTNELNGPAPEGYVRLVNGYFAGLPLNRVAELLERNLRDMSAKQP